MVVPVGAADIVFWQLVALCPESDESEPAVFPEPSAKVAAKLFTLDVYWSHPLRPRCSPMSWTSTLYVCPGEYVSCPPTIGSAGVKVNFRSIWLFASVWQWAQVTYPSCGLPVPIRPPPPGIAPCASSYHMSYPS